MTTPQETDRRLRAELFDTQTRITALRRDISEYNQQLHDAEVASAIQNTEQDASERHAIRTRTAEAQDEIYALTRRLKVLDDAIAANDKAVAKQATEERRQSRQQAEQQLPDVYQTLLQAAQKAAEVYQQATGVHVPKSDWPNLINIALRQPKG